MHWLLLLLSGSSDSWAVKLVNQSGRGGGQPWGPAQGKFGRDALQKGPVLFDESYNRECSFRHRGFANPMILQERADSGCRGGCGESAKAGEN